MCPLPQAEPVALPPASTARISRVRQAAGSPPPADFIHFHDPAELVVIEAGSGQFRCNGWSTRFAPGTALYAPPMTVHDFTFDAGARGWTLVQFDPFALAALPLPWPAVPMAMTPAAPDRVAMLAAWLDEALADGAPAGRSALILQALLLAVWDGARTLADADAPEPLARFRPLLDRLHARPGAPPSLAEAATLCAMSPAYFARRFRAVFGDSYGHYQLALRLRLASRWLATSDRPVSAVAAAVGFSSHAHFSARFRGIFGVTPAAYRARREPGAGAADDRR